MRSSERVLVAAVVLWQLSAASKTASFAPFDEWKKAVTAGGPAALARLYSTNPPAVPQIGNKIEHLDDELRFWAGLRSSGVTEFNPKPAQNRAPGRRVAVLGGFAILGCDGVQSQGAGDCGRPRSNAAALAHRGRETGWIANERRPERSRLHGANVDARAGRLAHHGYAA